MAIWDMGFFENDMACDWENNIDEKSTLSYIESAITPILDESEDIIDIDICCKCLAACEALRKLVLKDGESTTYTKHLEWWVEAFSKDVPNELKVFALLNI